MILFWGKKKDKDETTGETPVEAPKDPAVADASAPVEAEKKTLLSGLFNRAKPDAPMPAPEVVEPAPDASDPAPRTDAASPSEPIATMPKVETPADTPKPEESSAPALEVPPADLETPKPAAS
ncbi:MAG: hypothetical protein AAGB25_02155, partial [Pseudomonadota bacterium]